VVLSSDSDDDFAAPLPAAKRGRGA
jgi:hypothetical protein